MGYATNYTYTVLGRTKTVTSGGAKVEYKYTTGSEDDTRTDLLRKILVDEGLVQYSFTYDSFARKSSVKVGNGTDAYTLASYTYYDDGLLARQYYGTTSSDTFVGYIYDDLDRVSKKRYNASDEASAQYSYDPNGNLLSVLDTMWGKTTQYEYDLAGRVVGTATIGNTVRFARAYEGITYNDGKGTIDSYYHKMVDANGDLLKTTNYTFTYGDATQGQIPDAVYTMVAGGKDFHFQYDNLGRLKKRTLSLNGGFEGVEEYTYKENSNNGNTSTVVASKRDFTGYLHTYTYNKNGNIKTETVGSNVREYTYDSLNRLVKYSDPVADVIESYTYDDRGNILTVKTRKYGTPESDASTITYTYGNTTYKDRLTKYNGQNITYGTLGNPTTWANGKSMTWQYGRNLITVGDNITYAYNADGLRISKSGARNTEYYIVGGKYIGEVTTISGTDYKIAYVYDETDSVIGINVNGNPYYFAKNLQGDVIAILNYQGDVIARYTYDIWGKLIAVKNADGTAITSNTHIAHLNPFRYRGYMYDKETGFYYLRSRYYDPEVGRFLNADALDTLTATPNAITDKNLFAYCDNNPVTRVDNGGQFWEIVALMAAGAAINALGSYLGALITNQDFTWADAGWAALVGSICAIPGCGPYIGGTMSGIGTAINNYNNGASLKGAIISGVVDGAIIYGSIGNLSNISNVKTGIVTEIAMDASFGTAGNIISSAASTSVVQLGNIQDTYSNSSRVMKRSTYDRVKSIQHTALTRIINGRIVTINKRASYIDDDEYGRIYCTVSLP